MENCLISNTIIILGGIEAMMFSRRTPRKAVSMLVALALIIQLFGIYPSQVQAAEAPTAEETDTQSPVEDSIAGLSDKITFGEEASESAHSLQGEHSKAVIGAKGLPARVALPLDPATYFGGDITFKMQVDPDKQNYFTLKIWGSDTSPYIAFLYAERERIGYQAEGDMQALVKSTSPVYENRFSYATQPIPLKFTKGRTEVELTIKTVVNQWNYGMGTSIRFYGDNPVNSISKHYYEGYSHTTTALPEEIIATEEQMAWTPRAGAELDRVSKDGRAWLNKQKNDINSFISTSIANKNSQLQSVSDLAKLSGYLRRDLGTFAFEQNGVEYDYTPDIMLSNKLRDDLLDRIRLGLDQFTLNYLAAPANYIGNWGSGIHQAGDALWTVYQLFEGQAKLAETDQYVTSDRPLVTDPVNDNRYGNKNNHGVEPGQKADKITGMFGAMYLTQSESQELGMLYQEGKYKSFDDWIKGSEIIDWGSEQIPTNQTNPFKNSAIKVRQNVIQDNEGKFQFYDTGVELADNKTTRLEAWQEMFYMCLSYNRKYGRSLTNQAFYSIEGTFNTNLGLLAIGSPLAENYSSSLRYLYEMTGVDYFLDNDVIDGNVSKSSGKYMVVTNLANFMDGFDEQRSYNGEKLKPDSRFNQVSPDGLTKEPSYVAAYGQATNYIVNYWRQTYDDELMKVALRAANARSFMNYQDTAGGNRIMRMEGVIESRGPSHPGYITYQGRADEGTGLLFTSIEPYMKANAERYDGAEWDRYWTYASNAVGHAQYQLMDNYYMTQANPYQRSAIGDYIYTADPGNYKGIVFPMTYTSSLTDKEKTRINAANPGYLDNREVVAFADIEDAIVAVRDGENVSFIEFWYNSSYGLNGIAKVHTVTPMVDISSTVIADVLYTPSGYWNTRSDFTVQRNVYDPNTFPIDGAVMADKGMIMPIAQSVNDGEGFDDYNIQPVRTGSGYSGYGEAYYMQYGKYFIVINTTTDKEFEIPLPSGYTSATIKNVLTGNNELVSEHRTVKAPASKALVLDLGASDIANETPSTPIFVTGTGEHGSAAISWSMASNVNAHYEVLRSATIAGPYESIGTTADASTTSFIDNSVVPGKSYYYKVRGVADVDGLAVKGGLTVYAKVDIPESDLPDNWVEADVTNASGLQASVSDNGGTIAFTGQPTTNEDEVYFAKDRTEVFACDHSWVCTAKEKLPNYAFAYKNSIVPTNPKLVLSSNGLENAITIRKGKSFKLDAQVWNGAETVSSDFTLQAKVTSDNPVGYSGLMVKELRNQKVTDNTRGIIFTVDNNGEYRIAYRQYPDGVQTFNYIGDGYDIFTNYNTDPITGRATKLSADGSYYLKLVRAGDYYNAYISPDGNEFELVGRELWVPMALTLIAGVATAQEATFSQIKLDDGFSDSNRPMTPVMSYREYGQDLELYWLEAIGAKQYSLFRTFKEDAEAYPVIALEQDDNGIYRHTLDESSGWEQVTPDDYILKYFMEQNVATSKTAKYVLVAFGEEGLPSSFSNVVELEGIGAKSAIGTNGRLALDDMWNYQEWTVARPGFAYMDLQDNSLKMSSQSRDRVSGDAGGFLYQEFESNEDFTIITRINSSIDLSLWGKRGIMVRNSLQANSGYVGLISQRLDYTGAWIRSSDGSSISKNIYDSNGPVGQNFRNDRDYWKKVVKSGNAYQVFYAPVTGLEQSYEDIQGWESLGPNQTNDVTSYTMNSTGSKLYAGIYVASFHDLETLTSLYAVPTFNIGSEGTTFEITEGTEQKIVVSAKDAFGVGTIAPTAFEYSLESDNGANVTEHAEFDAASGEFILKNTAPAGTYKASFSVSDPSGRNSLKGSVAYTIHVYHDAATRPSFDPIGNKEVFAGNTLSFLVSAGVAPDAMTMEIKDQSGAAVTPEEAQISFDSETGRLVWTAGPNAKSAVYTVTFVAESAAEDTDSISINVRVRGKAAFEVTGMDRYEHTENGDNDFTVEMRALDRFEVSVKVSDNNFYSTPVLLEMPEGAVYNRVSGLLTWTPSFEQFQSGNNAIRIGAYNTGKVMETLTIGFELGAPIDPAPVFVNDWIASYSTTHNISSAGVNYHDDVRSSFTLRTGSANGGNTEPNRTMQVAQPVPIKPGIPSTITTRLNGDINTVRYAGVMFGNAISILPQDNSNINRTDDNIIMYFSGDPRPNHADKGRIGLARLLNGSFASPLPLLDQSGQIDRSILGNVYLRATFEVQADGSANVTGAYSTDGVNFKTQNNWSFTLSKAVVDKGIYAHVLSAGLKPDGSGSAYDVMFDNTVLESAETNVKGYVGVETQIPSAAYHPYKNISYSYELVRPAHANPDQPAEEIAHQNGVLSFTPQLSGQYELIVKAAVENGEATKKYVIAIAESQAPVFSSSFPTQVSTWGGVESALNVSATHMNGDAIDYSMRIVKSGSSEDYTTAAFLSRSGMFHWTPQPAETGTYTVTVTATAKGPAALGVSAQKQFTIVVNDARVEFVNNWNWIYTTQHKPGTAKVTFKNTAKTAFTASTGSANDGNLYLGRTLRVYQPVVSEVGVKTTITAKVAGEAVGPGSTVRLAGIMFGNDKTILAPAVGGNHEDSSVIMYLDGEGNAARGTLGFARSQPGANGGNYLTSSLLPLRKADNSIDTSITGNVYLRATYELQPDGTGLVTGAYSTDGVEFKTQNSWKYTLSAELIQNGVYGHVVSGGKRDAGGAAWAHDVSFEDVSFEVTPSIHVNASAGEAFTIKEAAVHPFAPIAYRTALVQYAGDGDEQLAAEELAQAQYSEGQYRLTLSQPGVYTVQMIAEAGGADAAKAYQITVAAVEPLRALLLEGASVSSEDQPEASDQELEQAANSTSEESAAAAPGAEAEAETVNHTGTEVQTEFGTAIDVSDVASEPYEAAEEVVASAKAGVTISSASAPTEEKASGIEWSVSDTGKLKLNDTADTGTRVTGLAAGVAYVYADFNNQRYEYRVTVLDPPPPFEGPTGGSAASEEVVVTGDGIKVLKQPDGSSKLIVKLTDKQLLDGTGSKQGEFKIEVAAAADVIEVQLPANVLKGKLADGSVSGIKLVSGSVHVTLPAEALKTIVEQGGEQISIRIEKKRASLPGTAAYSVQLLTDGKAVQALPTGTAALILIPFELGAGDKPEMAVAYYVDENGQAKVIKRSVYANGGIEWAATQLGEFAVGVANASFSDVRDQHWAQAPILYLAAREIVNGKGNDVFDPEGNITRAEFVKLIVNTLDLQASGDSPTFNDVDQTDWYYDYVSIASSLGLVYGKENGKFDPTAPIKREDMAVIIERAMKYLNMQLPESGSSSFKDEAEMADYAKTAVSRIAAFGIVKGMPDGGFAPKALSTRAQSAMMIYKLFQHLL
jgi:hypothetical protein